MSKITQYILYIPNNMIYVKNTKLFKMGLAKKINTELLKQHNKVFVPSQTKLQF